MDTTNGRTVEIREAMPADAVAIATVHATSWRETYGRFVENPETSGWFAIDRRIRMWSENLDKGIFTTMVATIDGDVVGFAAAQPTSDSEAVRAEELTMLYVVARAHGTGAGQGLLDAVLADQPAQLWVAADNPRAHAFYRRNGFRPDGAESSFGPIPATVRLVR